MPEIVIIGGTSGIGLALAAACATSGNQVAIAGRDLARAAAVAADLTATLPAGSGQVRGLAADLSQPHTLASTLSSVEAVHHLVLTAVERHQNSLASYDIDAAIGMATVKIVGYTAAVAALRQRFATDGSVLLFGGMAKEWPTPGSMTMSSVTAAVDGLSNSLMHELKPLRVNAIHPGLVADSAYWAGKDAVIAMANQAALTGTAPHMRDIVDGCLFLMRNPAANGVSLNLDSGRAR